MSCNATSKVESPVTILNVEEGLIVPKSPRFRNLRIRTKIIIIVGLAFLSTIVVGLLMALEIQNHADAEIENTREMMLFNAQQEMVDLVDAAYTMLKNSYAQSSTVEGVKKEYGNQFKTLMQVPFGIIQEKYNEIDKYKDEYRELYDAFTLKAQNEVKKLVRIVRYGEHDYYWINDTTPKMLLDPKDPSLEGQDLSNFSIDGYPILAEGSNAPLFEEISRVAKENPEGGFVAYRLPDPDQQGRWISKIVYVRYFAPWDWVVTAGFRLDVFTAQTLRRTLETINKIRYGRDNYLFILDQNGVMLAHPDPSLIGKNMLTGTDDETKEIYRQIMEMAQTKGRGQLKYQCSRYPGQPLQEKQTHVRLFKPWDLIIGTDLYAGGIQIRVEAQQARLNEQLKTRIIYVSLTALGILAVVLALALFISRRYIEKPLRKTVALLGDIAGGEGDLTKRLRSESMDEVGRMSYNFNKFADQIQKIVEMVGQELTNLTAWSEELSTVSTEMSSQAKDMKDRSSAAHDAITETGAGVQNMAQKAQDASMKLIELSQASKNISASLNAIGVATEGASNNLSLVASSATQMSGSVNAVATSVEEMYASLNEVAKNASRGANVSSDASDQAGRSSVIVHSLGDAAKEIGDVVDLIRGIAAQTNLLALNATIEAASAGEAGKGFAVVANEVKELAKQTANATEDIREKVEGIQTNTHNAVSVIENIVKYITEMDSIMHTIASAVEEQTATTNEISRNISEVAGAAKDVSQNVNDAAQEAQVAAKRLKNAVHTESGIADGITNVTDAATSIAQDVDDAANRAELINDYMTQMNDSVEVTTVSAAQINNAAFQLTEVAYRLKTIVDKFKV